MNTINYFKAAERALTERGRLETALANLKRRRDRAISRSGPSGLSTVDYTKPYVSSGAAGDALSSCLEVATITRQIAATEEEIAEIDRVLGQLEAADRDLLRAWYIEGKPKEEITEALSYSSRTSIYDLRNKAVSAFAVLYFGAPALPST